LADLFRNVPVTLAIGLLICSHVLLLVIGGIVRLAFGRRSGWLLRMGWNCDRASCTYGKQRYGKGGTELASEKNH